MIMVAQGDAEDFFRLFLFDDKAVEEGFDLAGSFIEVELLFRLSRGRGFRSAGRFGFGHGAAGQVLAHEILQLALEFLRGGRTVEGFFRHHL